MTDYSHIDLSDTIDLHVHTGPDIWPRKFDDLELARQAAARRMRAILIKSHWTLTADRAFNVEKMQPGLRVFGGLALNHTVGGLNPAAVEVALKLGAAQIWMPTLSSAAEPKPMFGPGITILENDGLKAELMRILELIAQQDAILGTGHLSASEIMRLVPVARDLGVRKILITHPEHPPVELPAEDQQALRAQYDVFFERCLISTPFGGGNLPFERLAEIISQVGFESSVIATDFGQAENPSPAEGMACFISQLLDHGFSTGMVERMSISNPAYLLDI